MACLYKKPDFDNNKLSPNLSFTMNGVDINMATYISGFALRAN